ncbi:hypothetical protein [Methylobacterium iners]|uniref:Uncharacterized protein n=1 Tax=Methylobacterium iners TaxID=418707 RepID=A0ABQ4RZG5_9HYPH|nr:hypothetical protein [Methylobacterium iners]GJD96248.1 hypothetical protein OCOJLMKI_3468 [Methylobacterium iners]
MGFVSATVKNEGTIAKTAGKPMQANPYPAGSQESADWLEGFTFDEAAMNVDHEDATDANRS